MLNNILQSKQKVNCVDRVIKRFGTHHNAVSKSANLIEVEVDGVKHWLSIATGEIGYEGQVCLRAWFESSPKIEKNKWGDCHVFLNRKELQSGKVIQGKDDFFQMSLTIDSNITVAKLAELAHKFLLFSIVSSRAEKWSTTIKSFPILKSRTRTSLDDLASRLSSGVKGVMRIFPMEMDQIKAVIAFEDAWLAGKSEKAKTYQSNLVISRASKEIETLRGPGTVLTLRTPKLDQSAMDDLDRFGNVASIAEWLNSIESGFDWLEGGKIIPLNRIGIWKAQRKSRDLIHIWHETFVPYFLEDHISLELEVEACILRSQKFLRLLGTYA